MPDGAYQDMEPFHERDEQELQAIASEVLAAFVAPIDEEVARSHMLAIMQEVSDPSRMTLEPAPRSKVRRRVLRLVTATGLGLGMLTGLAFAGALPDAMQDALSDAADRAGFFSLPASEAHRQDADHRKDGSQTGNADGKGKSVSNDVKEVLNDDSLEGKDKGDAVSDVASQNRQNDEHANPSGVTDTATGSPPDQGNPNKPDKP